MKNRMPLFTYGTLQDIEIQTILFGKEILMKKATLDNWRIYSDEEGYYFIAKEQESFVEGHIMYLSQEELLVADQWEEVPTYSRIMVVVKLAAGITCKSWAYVKDNKKGKPVINAQFSNRPRAEVIVEAKKIVIRDNA